jgi:hypothetical protein
MEAQLADRWLPIRLVAVVDTDVILANLIHQARATVTPRLLRAASDGTVRLFAANHVYFETYDKLSEVAADTGLDVATLRELFEEEHLPLITFVNMSGEFSGRVPVTDAKDVPTAALADLISPCVLFSRDRHLRDPGLAPPNWLEVAGAAVHAGELDRRERGLGITIYAPSASVTLLIRWVARRLGVSPWLVAGGLGAWMYAVLRDPKRRRAAGEWISRAAEAFTEVVAQGEIAQAAGLREIRTASLPEPTEPTVVHAVARTLAWAPEPLLAGEVTDLLDALPGGEPLTVADVRSVLNSCSTFVRRQHARYQLGRYAGPLR